MKEEKETCLICGKTKTKLSNKTCGNPKCRGDYAELKTKKRIERQKAAEPYIRSCASNPRLIGATRKSVLYAEKL
jgi:hypothetical protein